MADLRQVLDAVTEAEGWRLVERNAGRGYDAYAPDGETIVRILGDGGDWRSLRNAMAGLRRAGLDLREKPGRRRSADYRKARRAAAKEAAVPEPVNPSPDDESARRAKPIIYTDAVMSWSLSAHARERCRQRGYDYMEAQTAAEHPDLSFPWADDPRYHLRSRGQVTVVVVPDRRLIVTVLHNLRGAGGDEHRDDVFAEARRVYEGRVTKPEPRVEPTPTAIPEQTAPAHTMLSRAAPQAAAASLRPSTPTEKGTPPVPIVWEEPPEAARGPNRRLAIDKFADDYYPALRGNPGRWALWETTWPVAPGTKPSGSAGSMAKSIKAVFADVETAVRTTWTNPQNRGAGGETRLYVRFKKTEEES